MNLTCSQEHFLSFFLSLSNQSVRQICEGVRQFFCRGGRKKSRGKIEKERGMIYLSGISLTLYPYRLNYNRSSLHYIRIFFLSLSLSLSLSLPFRFLFNLFFFSQFHSLSLSLPFCNTFWLSLTHFIRIEPFRSLSQFEVPLISL